MPFRHFGSFCVSHSWPMTAPEVRFWKFPVQRLGQVPEGSGADTQVRIRKVRVQRLGEVPEGSCQVSP